MVSEDPLYLGKKRAERDQAKISEDQRQKVISYKKFFGSPEGQEVMLDLMNRFYILTPLPQAGAEFERGIAEGKRQAVLHLLGQAHMDMAQFDRVLKGDFS